MSTLITNGIALINDPKLISPKLCNEIVDYIEGSELLIDNQNVQGRYVLPTHQEKIHSKILKVFKKLQDRVRHELNLDVIGDSGFQLRKIHGTTRLHQDGVFDKLLLRSLSCIIALNGDFGGGEISFPLQNFRYQMNKGDILLFPPYWTHPHQVYPPHAGTYRYTINTWFYDIESKKLNTTPEDQYINFYD